MELRMWSSSSLDLKEEVPSSLKALASTRSLILNPTTSDSTISSILHTLISSLSHHPPRRHLIKLLSDLASSCPHYSAAVFHALRSDTALSSASLSALSDQAPLHDDGLFLSLCFRADVPFRLWLLRNAEGLQVRPSLLFVAFLGFTNDPCPYVREAALNGLAKMCGFEDRSVVEGCYSRAVELLQDFEDCVRVAAIRVVSEWGLMLVAIADTEEDRSDWSDAVFLQLGAAIRDMCMAVRVEALDAMMKFPTVSEDILLQTLSKRVLPKIKEKKFSASIRERCTILASSAAGAFLHGLEDEFFEVRKSACHTLQSLFVLSAEFANQALNLLMDVLNDESIFVSCSVL